MKSLDIIKLLNRDPKEYFETEYISKERSVLSIATELNISRDSVYKTLIVLGIKSRTSSEQATVDFKNGRKHPHLGKNKLNNDWARRVSERMIKNNPSQNPSTREKMSESIAKTYRKNLYPQEKLFAKHLKRNRIKFKMQVPFGPYIMDFFIEAKNLCIEIDSRSKWGGGRKIRAEKRDQFFLSKGIKTVRINKNKLDDKLLIDDILRANNII